MNEQEAWAIESAGENAIETYNHLLKNRPLGDADKRRVLKAKAAAEWIEQSGTLIAAAPELLSALRVASAVLMAARVEVYNHNREAYPRVEEAIDLIKLVTAKATGGA